MSDNNKSSNKSKLFGRNVFTLYIIVPILFILILGIFITVNYISTYNNNKIIPFENKSVGVLFTDNDGTNSFNVENAKQITEEEFTEFGYILKCIEYNEDSKTAKYEFRPYKLETTKAITNDKVSVALCLKTDWIGFVGYSSTSAVSATLSSDLEKAESTTSATYKKDLSITSLVDLPAKVDTWPVKVKVNEPEIYLYLEYSYQENGKTKTNTFIVEYSYSDLIPESGGIRQ